MRICFRRSHAARLLLLGVVALCGVTARGADWPQFRGLNRDGHSPETGLLKKWPEAGLTPLWTADGLGRGYASVTVANGKLYTTGMAQDTDEGFLFAFDLNGAPLWKKSYGPDWNAMYPGARACPTVDGDRLYLLSGAGRIVCFDAGSGATRWTRDLAKDFGGVAPMCGFVEGLFIDGPRVICAPGGPEVTFAALDKMTGKTVWTSKGFNDQNAYCSPILVERGGRQLITITAQFVAGFDPKSGEVIWNRPFDTGADKPNHSNSPVYADGRFYATSGHFKGGHMFELSADGKKADEKWADETLNTNHGGVVLVDGYIYGTNAKGHWVCLELATGKVMYDGEGVGPAALIYAEGMFYCYSEKGVLALVPAKPGECHPAGQFKVTQGDGQHWAHPTISNGRLYVRHGKVMMAYDIKAK